MSARQVDENGFITIENNPISRVGVFPYLGANIDPSLPPDEIVWVYRPSEELGSEECLNSFKMLPFIDDHTMVGSPDEGYTPAEKKGVHGTIGETVAFRDGVLYATIKVFSSTLAALIESGKTALSLGYRCQFIKQAGTFAGQAYTYVQRSLRGNHIALVDAARCDVQVLDGKFAMDNFDLNIGKKEKTMPTIEELDAKITAQDAAIKGLQADNVKLKAALDEKEKEDDKKAEDEDDKEKDKKAEDADEDKKDKEKAEDESESEKEKDKGMDAAINKKIDAMDAELKSLKKDNETLKKDGVKAMLSEVSKRDQLAARLTPFIGTFDHMEKTLDEVAAYGCEKLGLTPEKGHEKTALDSYLHGRPLPGDMPASYAVDAASKGGKGLDAYLNKAA